MITVTHYKVRHPCNNVKENYKQTAFIACESPVRTLFVSLLSFCPLLLLCFIFIVPYFLPSFYFGDEDERGDTILCDVLMKEEIYCG